MFLLGRLLDQLKLNRDRQDDLDRAAVVVGRRVFPLQHRLRGRNVETEADERELRGLVEAHFRHTRSDRAEARKTRNWERADEIRDRLAELGWEVRDSPDGAKLRKLTA